MVNINYAKACEENNEHAYSLNINTRKYNRTHIGMDANVNLIEAFDEKNQVPFSDL